MLLEVLLPDNDASLEIQGTSLLAVVAFHQLRQVLSGVPLLQELCLVHKKLATGLLERLYPACQLANQTVF